jgi:CDP-diacylglycerol--glycerol-3-phosphate 3-phosphatidyltransferase
MTAKLRHTFRVREFVYPSNLLSLARVAMLVPILKNLEHPARRWHALGYIAVAMFTDALDGILARSRGEISQLGKILDPIADKLLMNAVAVRISQTREFPWWMTRLLLLRDAVILLLGFYMYRRREKIAVSQSAGKAFTATLTGTMLVYTADGPRRGKPLLYASLLTLVLSCVQYGWAFVQSMRDTETHER